MLSSTNRNIWISPLTQPNSCRCKRRHNNGVILKLQQVLRGLTGYSLATVQEASWGHCVYGKSSQLSTEVMMRSYNTQVQRRAEEPLRPSCSGAEPSVNCNNSSARWVRLLRGERGLSSRCRLPCTRKKNQCTCRKDGGEQQETEFPALRNKQVDEKPIKQKKTVITWWWGR